MPSKANPVKRVTDVAEEKLGVGRDAYRQILIGPEEGPNFAMRRFVIRPGGEIPTHTNTVEHEQYVLRGRAQIGIGDRVFDVKRDDIVFIPAGTPHWYRVQGDEPFEFLCVVPNEPDKMEMLDK